MEPSNALLALMEPSNALLALMEPSNALLATGQVAAASLAEGGIDTLSPPGRQGPAAEVDDGAALIGAGFAHILVGALVPEAPPSMAFPRGSEPAPVASPPGTPTVPAPNGTPPVGANMLGGASPAPTGREGGMPPAAVPPETFFRATPDGADAYAAVTPQASAEAPAHAVSLLNQASAVRAIPNHVTSLTLMGSGGPPSPGSSGPAAADPRATEGNDGAPRAPATPDGAARLTTSFPSTTPGEAPAPMTSFPGATPDGAARLTTSFPSTTPGDAPAPMTSFPGATTPNRGTVRPPFAATPSTATPPPAKTTDVGFPPRAIAATPPTATPPPANAPDRVLVEDGPAPAAFTRAQGTARPVPGPAASPAAPSQGESDGNPAPSGDAPPAPPGIAPTSAAPVRAVQPAAFAVAAIAGAEEPTNGSVEPAVAPAIRPVVAPAAEPATEATVAPAAEPALEPAIASAQAAEAVHRPGGLAPSTAAETTSSEPPRPPAEQIAVRISSAAKEGLDKIHIRLKPTALGRIDVDLDVKLDGRVSAVISADRPETLDMLQRDARGLERALENAGLRPEPGGLSFNLRGDGREGAGSEQPTERAEAPLKDGSADDAAAADAAPTRRPAGDPRRLVDIEV